VAGDELLAAARRGVRRAWGYGSGSSTLWFLEERGGRGEANGARKMEEDSPTAMNCGCDRTWRREGDFGGNPKLKLELVSIDGLVGRGVPTGIWRFHL